MHPESLPGEIEGRDGESVDASVESSTRATLRGRLWYWWSMSAAAMLLLILGPPAIGLSLLLGDREKLYPWALFGGSMWLRLSGARVRVRGLEHIDPKRPYVFIANHRSFLDHAT